MQLLSYSRKTENLLDVYEQNYALFRLVLPIMPEVEGWFMLKREGLPNIYVYRLSVHPYTSEWILGHVYPNKNKIFSPNHVVRIYHDARLAEIRSDQTVPVAQQKKYKLELNHALTQWLDYCHRRRYQIVNYTDRTHLPDIKNLVKHAG